LRPLREDDLDYLYRWETSRRCGNTAIAGLKKKCPDTRTLRAFHVMSCVDSSKINNMVFTPMSNSAS
jgi:hypothetical protein